MVKRNPHKITFAERLIIQEGLKQGKSLREICILLHISFYTLSRWMNQHNYNYYRGNSLRNILERLEILEQHNEIILDLIKELRK